MQEEHQNQINGLMDDLLKRLKFDIEHQPPAHLPAISVAVSNLYGLKDGLANGNEKQMMEINLLKQVTNQIKNHGKGNDRPFPPPGSDLNVPL